MKILAEAIIKICLLPDNLFEQFIKNIRELNKNKPA